MKYRRLGKTNFEVSEVSLGTWQLGEAWGSVSDEDAVRVLQAALDHGINFFDTADVYGDERSERFIAQVLAKHTEKIYVVTKTGRRLQPHIADGYNRKNLTAFVERSLANLKRELAILRRRPDPFTKMLCVSKRPLLRRQPTRSNPRLFLSRRVLRRLL